MTHQDHAKICELLRLVAEAREAAALNEPEPGPLTTKLDEITDGLGTLVDREAARQHRREARKQRGAPQERAHQPPPLFKVGSRLRRSSVKRHRSKLAPTNPSKTNAQEGLQ